VTKDDLTEPPVLDKTALYDQVGDEPELLLHVIGLFLKDSRTTLEHIRDGFSRRDGDTIGRGAHRLKGALLLLGAARAAEVARQLEQLGQEGYVDQAALTLTELQGELTRLEPELAALTSHGV
jgi:two-component system sensor histidine kinase/response regulator